MLGAQCSVFSVNSTMAPHIHRLTMPTSRCSFAYLIYLTSTSTSTSSTNSRQKSCFICIYACIICLRKSLFANEFCSFGRNDVCINNPLTVECCAVIILLDPLWKKKGRDGSSCCACICERERGTRRGPCRWKCSILRIKRNIIQSFRFVRIWCVRIGDLWMDLPCMGYEHQFFSSCAGCGWWCNQLPHHYKAIHCDAHLCAREHDDY